MNLMRSVVCPVSNEKVPENQTRVIAFFVSSLFFLFLLTNFLPIVIFLGYDFFVRGFNYPKISPLYHISKIILSISGKSHKLIDRAPKLFAARIGFVICTFILLGAGFGLNILLNSLTILIIIFSTLEWMFNICVGCIMYSWIILPFYKKVK